MGPSITLVRMMPQFRYHSLLRCRGQAMLIVSATIQTAAIR
jgi:hypothetical protein